MHIPDPRLGVVDGDGGADGLHQVGLAEANATEEEEGVVVGAGRLGDGPRRLPGKLVGASDHEVGKVEPARQAGCPQTELGRLVRRCVGESNRCGRWCCHSCGWQGRSDGRKIEERGLLELGRVVKEGELRRLLFDGRFGRRIHAARADANPHITAPGQTGGLFEVAVEGLVDLRGRGLVAGREGDEPLGCVEAHRGAVEELAHRGLAILPVQRHEGLIPAFFHQSVRLRVAERSKAVRPVEQGCAQTGEERASQVERQHSTAGASLCGCGVRL